MKIGVLCPSEIAYRRFMPALNECQGLFEYVGVAYASRDEWMGNENIETQIETERGKAKLFQKEYGGRVFEGYTNLLTSEIDCVYIPLPPALHFQWGELALRQGKHLFLEKPFTTSLEDTSALISLAEDRSLAVHENYMFQFHTQINNICDEIDDGTIGDVRLIRINFGFPFRGKDDFRYNKVLGGGALLDCGGYTIKLASMVLGGDVVVTGATLNSPDGFDVDIFGSAVLKNDKGMVAQIAFGMDNDYRCSLDIWGSHGSLFTNRILTAPKGYAPILQINRGNETDAKELEQDDTFKKSIHYFYKCINNEGQRQDSYSSIKLQAGLMDDFLRLAYADN